MAIARPIPRFAPVQELFAPDRSSRRTGGGGQTEVDRAGSARALVELREFPFGAGEADFETFDLAEPTLALGFGDAGQQVVADRGDPLPLGGIGPQQAAPEAVVLVAQLVP
jgi:hypothetical protein